MQTVKIYGAGSIGNHMANASRAMGMKVDVVDIDETALNRMKGDIYPSRYGAWDENISLHTPKDEPVGGHDLIIVGTPPDTHVQLAREAVKSRPSAILVEKPLCSLGLENLRELIAEADEHGVRMFIGYDHVVGKATQLVEQYIAEGAIGAPLTIDVEFREHWGGIFAAHPWLAGPSDSYLGFSQRGGGASGEHSHGINLWQHLCHVVGGGRVEEVDARLDFGKDGTSDFDSLCAMNLRSENGIVGRCIQDVVTRPHKKWASIQGEQGRIEWYCGAKAGTDTVILHKVDGEAVETSITKTRPEDFIQELEHIKAVVTGDVAESPIDIKRGADTMLAIVAAHNSHLLGKRINLEYSTLY